MDKHELKVLQMAESLLADVQHNEPYTTQTMRRRIRDYFSSHEREQVVAVIAENVLQKNDTAWDDRPGSGTIESGDYL